MKNYKKYLLITALVMLINTLQAQTINWASLKKEDRHIINTNLGFEYGAVFGLGYGYHLKTRKIPVVLNVEYSFPSGNQLLDDFKTRIGAQIRWIRSNDFQFSTRIQGVFRRYGNELVRLVNFGSDISGTAGFYHSKWFIAAEVGFDKAIVTNFKHTQTYKDQYAAVADGWYEPATGGNFYYGLQAGYSFKKYDLYLRAGKMITQDFKTTPLIPMYGQLGCTMKF